MFEMEYCINLRTRRGTASNPFPALNTESLAASKTEKPLFAPSWPQCQQLSGPVLPYWPARAILSKLSDKLSRSIRADYRDKPTGQAAEIRQLISWAGRPWNSRRVKMLSTAIWLLNKSSWKITVQESCRCLEEDCWKVLLLFGVG